VLGIAPPPAKARAILSALGLGVRARGRDAEVDIPSFRRDLTMEDDLVEEVIRVWGYDRLPTTFSRGDISLARDSDIGRQERLVRSVLVGAGLTECVTYAFSDPARAGALGGPAPLKLLNPLSQDASALRAHPLEGLLAVVATNLRRQQPSVRVFELARTYEPALTGDTSTAEPRWTAIALAGARADEGWDTPRTAVDVYDAKGMAEVLLDAFGLRATTVPGGRLSGFEADSHATLKVGDTVVGEFGEVAASVRAAFDIGVPVFAAALSLDGPVPLAPQTARYQTAPRYPSIERDMAFVLADPATTAAAVAAAIREQAGPLLRDVRVFDVFRLPDGGRSVAYRLTFQADNRTLTDEEINTVHARVAEAVSRRFGITLRGS
jgi:phenylalanyl-tRNA synthetase beta chain